MDYAKKAEYLKRQEEWVKTNNVVEGTEVLVLRKAEDFEDGWDNNWVSPNMDEMVGEVCRVLKIDKYGINLKSLDDDSDFDSWDFPYFVLSVDKYEVNQAKWANKHGVGIGSLVKVVRSVPSQYQGWDNYWVHGMDNTVGVVFPVLHMSRAGILLITEDYGYYYPFYALEPVENNEEANEEANEETNEEVNTMEDFSEYIDTGALELTMQFDKEIVSQLTDSFIYAYGLDKNVVSDVDITIVSDRVIMVTVELNNSRLFFGHAVRLKTDKQRPYVGLNLALGRAFRQVADYLVYADFQEKFSTDF